MVEKLQRLVIQSNMNLGLLTQCCTIPGSINTMQLSIFVLPRSNESKTLLDTKNAGMTIRIPCVLGQFKE